MNKRGLVAKIVAHLESELEAYARSARAAHAEATHEQSKAENKYDTRGLEASYLAQGQSRQAAELEEARRQFEGMEIRDFTPGDKIDLGALVELQGKSGTTCYFLGPRAGGTEIVHEGKEVLVITPHSPLGRELMGKKQGERWTMTLGGARGESRIVAVR